MNIIKTSPLIWLRSEEEGKERRRRGWRAGEKGEKRKKGLKRKGRKEKGRRRGWRKAKEERIKHGVKNKFVSVKRV